MDIWISLKRKVRKSESVMATAKSNPHPVWPFLPAEATSARDTGKRKVVDGVMCSRWRFRLCGGNGYIWVPTQGE